MKKLLLLFAVLLGTVGAWAQKLVTSVAEGKYYTLQCNSTSHTSFLGENALGLNGQSAKPTYLIFESTEGGYYVKSALTGKYLNQGEAITEGSKYAVAYSTEKTTVWTVGKLSDDATDVYLTIGDTKLYLNNNNTGEHKIQIIKHNPIGTGNACSLWEMREHEDSYKVIESIGDNITDLNQLTDGSYVTFYNVGRQKYIYEGLEHKLWMGTEPAVGAGHEYIFRVRKEGEKYAFMAMSGRYISTPLDPADVFTVGIDNNAKDEFTITKHHQDETKWKLQSTNNANLYFDGQDAKFVGWQGNGTNSQYEIKPVVVKESEHALAEFITADENIIKWVNIKNVRSGKFATYEGESTKMTQKTDNACSKAFFYLTGEIGSNGALVKIHNFATDNLCAEYNSWTAAGTNWNIMASQGQGIHPGWAISKGTTLGDGNAWNNEGGGGSTIAYWNGNDQGSTWAFVSADYHALVSKLDGLKEELKSVVAAANTAYEDGNVTEVPVTLSATEGDDGYLYSNADGKDNSYDGDDLGVGALIDGKDGTFLHTNYQANSTDGLDHYIRVDMGENNTIDYFSFGYKGRQNGGGNSPKTMIIEGSNDNDKYYEIATLTNLPGGNNAYASEPMGGKPYRYIRFMVTETQNGGNHAGHQFFALASFNLNKVTVKDGAAVKTLMYNNLSKSVAEAERVLASSKSTEDDINGLMGLLPTIVAGLEVHEYPFELTKNVNDPVCYFIKSARSKEWGGNYYWTFENGKVTTIVPNDEYAKDVEAYWFFMENQMNGQLQLVPFIEHTKPMGYTTVGNSNDRLTNNTSASGFVGTGYIFKEDTESTGDWMADYPYALKPAEGGDNYVSNCNGKDGHYMGFWNDFNDKGTRFIIEEAEIVPSAKLRDLRTALAACTDVPADQAKDEIGWYSSESYATYSSIMTPALAAYNDATLAENIYTDVLATLTNDPATLLEINMPQEGNFYRFSHNYGGEVGNLYVQAVACGVQNKENGMLMSADQDAKSIFYYADNQLLSYSKGLYVHDQGNARGLQAVGVAGGSARFVAGTVVGQLGIYAGDSFHANTSGDIRFIDHCGSVHNADHNFTVEEVTSLPITISAAGYATFYCPVAVTLPEGLTAYYVASTDNGKAQMTPITDVIPANTGVILKGEAGPYCLTIGGEAVAVEDNKLSGTAAATYITEDAYVLSKVDEVVGFNKAAKNQQSNSSWLNNAFKAYLPANAVTTADARFLVFSFGADNETAIEGVEAENSADAVVYDLAGRRVQNAQKGVFIVNGKVVIK